MLAQSFPFTPNGFYQRHLARLAYKPNIAGPENDFAAWIDDVMAQGQMCYMNGKFRPGLASMEPPQTFVSGVNPQEDHNWNPHSFAGQY